MNSWLRQIFLIINIINVFNFSFVHADPELLKTADVQRIMNEILQRHVEKKQLSPAIFQGAIRSYIESFDPMRVYLLEQEVKPFAYMQQFQLNTILDQYEKGDYTVFQQLDALFQRAIIRSRKLREELEASKESLFKDAIAIKAKEDLPPVSTNFATSPAALKNRIKDELVSYINSQIKRFGNEDVTTHADAVISNFEDEVRTHENPYFYQDIEGQALSDVKKENLFAIHVLKALAGTLDAHTSIFNPDEAYDMRVRLEKGMNSVGLVVKKGPDGVFVDKVIKNSPADKDGSVKIGDRLVAVNGRSAHNIPFEELINQLGGENAQEVNLLIKRKGGQTAATPQQTFSVNLKPTMVTVDEDRVETSYVKFEDGIIGTIVLKTFYKGANGVTSDKDVADGIRKLQKIGNIKGIILDLRGNTGGFLTQAVKVAGLFITNGVVVISKYSNGEEHFYRDTDGKTLYDGPLVVLTSKTTASAAEIVAQALQDYGVALVVGDPHTYGKGTIQSQTVTGTDHAASYFKVTVGKYYTVSGKTPQLKGVKADVVVPGELSFEEIGEEYLEDAIPADKIEASFKDPLMDIDPTMKSWYKNYYLPSLQKKVQVWQQIVPTIREKSMARIKSNKDYQRYLLLLAEYARNGKEPTINLKAMRDLQHQEAVNIVEDMIQLNATQNVSEASIQKNLPVHK